MKPNESTGVAAEINRLHAECQRLASASETNLRQALATAWKIGRLLLDQKQTVRQKMGSGAWLHWLKANFRGTARTARNYMRLAEKVDAAGALTGLSLRQTYFRLGIATEPKPIHRVPQVHELPPHVRLANRLLATLKPPQMLLQAAPAERAAYCADLRALYERLRRLLEPGAEANFGAGVGSKRTWQNEGNREPTIRSSAA